MKLRIKAKILSVHEKMDVLDENDEVLYRVSRKAISVHDKTHIEDAAGNEVASIHAKVPSIHHIYYVDMADGTSFSMKEELAHLRDHIDVEELGWQLRGENVLAFDFGVFDAEGRQIAMAHRKLATLHGEYDLDVLDEGQVDKIVALFIVIAHIIALRQETATLPVTQPSN